MSNEMEKQPPLELEELQESPKKVAPTEPAQPKVAQPKVAQPKVAHPNFELPVFGGNFPRVSAASSMSRHMGNRIMDLDKWEKYHYDDLDRVYWEYIRPNVRILGRISWRSWVRFCYDHSSHVKYSHDLF